MPSITKLGKEPANDYTFNFTHKNPKNNPQFITYNINQYKLLRIAIKLPANL